MRYHFQNIERPKRATANIAGKIGATLSLTRECVAPILGYDNWHDLEKNHAKGVVFTPDENLPDRDFIERQVVLSLALADKMRVPDGDVQYALAESKLTGNRPCLLADQLKIRTRCLRLTSLPMLGKKQAGEVGRLKLGGSRDGELVILRSYTDRTHFFRPAVAVSQRNVAHIASFEYVSPRVELPLFIPARLYIPYGYYIEADGAKVLYSRDYKPMWRIRQGKSPERVEPWLWIKHSDSVSLWTPGQKDPWDNLEDRKELEAVLVSFGVKCLPMLVDALPLVVKDSEISKFDGAADALKFQRLGIATAAE